MGNQYTIKGRSEYWTELVTRWRSSGMTKKAFCETNDLGYYTFLRWTNRVPSGEQSGQTFVEIPTKPVAIAARPAMAELECCGVTLRVPVDIDERELSRLLRAVENR